MYGIFTYIWLLFMVYVPYMDPMGILPDMATLSLGAPPIYTTILLMVQKSGEKTTWDVQSSANGKNYKLPTSTGDRRISEPSTVPR